VPYIDGTMLECNFDTWTQKHAVQLATGWEVILLLLKEGTIFYMKISAT
jgi:hypothetical protein